MQVAVVTGGSRGIGQATARLLAQRGAAVCVNYAVHADAAEALVAEITTAGGRAIAVVADVADHRHRPGRDIFSRRTAGTPWSRYCSLRGNLLL
jgi:NAD(P)-dependent dehydrogenase (short-subunit alcohol dehydrogenase family)